MKRTKTGKRTQSKGVPLGHRPRGRAKEGVDRKKKGVKEIKKS